MRLDATEAVYRFQDARVARLATVGVTGAPHLVPVTFAMPAADRIVFAVDHKPKRGNALRRLGNIEHEPRVSFLADAYDEDWTALWWVRADGTATLHQRMDPVHIAGVHALLDKYPQYRDQPPVATLVSTVVTNWIGWSAAGTDQPS